MDINTMLSAAYDAYESKLLEIKAARETMKEMADEITTLKNKVKELEATIASLAPVNTDSE